MFPRPLPELRRLKIGHPPTHASHWNSINSLLYEYSLLPPKITLLLLLMLLTPIWKLRLVQWSSSWLLRGKDGAFPSVAQRVHILLIDCNTSWLMLLASQFEEQLYKVTTIESATSALSLFRGQKNYFDIVIADFDMQDMDVKVFVQKVRRISISIPIILTAEDYTMDSAREAIGYGASFFLPKPIDCHEIASIWQHISRLTGDLPALTDITNDNNIKKYVNPSIGSNSGGAARNSNGRNLKRKIINIDEENRERRNNQIVEDLNTARDITEGDGRNPKKSRMTWTTSLHEKFLQALRNLGELKAAPHPKVILKMMNVPGLTHRQVSSHLQKYRDRIRHAVNPSEIADPVLPTGLPTAPTNNFIQGQISGIANVNCTAKHGASQLPRSPSWLNAPHFACKGLEGVQQKLDALNYPGNNTMNSVINNGGVRVANGSGGVHIARGIDLNHHNGIANAYMMGQAPLSTRAFGHMTVEAGHWSNGLQAPNQEPAGDFGMSVAGSRNAGNFSSLNNVNFREGPSNANQQLHGVPTNGGFNRIIQDCEASGANTWGLI